ncbi:hypothetical protein PZB74_21490 [Porifericola rhodea]|uniref:hypothetical protein n=1 Tax=Porifericola rhodea TaxID=930972 RepID=UPI0026665144|nr:hypothetical protein [Porifericola rhodea]WKN31525.1 hypothetical protein PZB74_21490 [Porifericola rhodea]
MDNHKTETQEKLEALWRKHEKDAISDDEGTYISLQNINLSDHGLSLADTRAPGNLSLSPTSTTQNDNYFLRGFEAGNVRLFRNRTIK